MDNFAIESMKSHGSVDAAHCISYVRGLGRKIFFAAVLMGLGVVIPTPYAVAKEPVPNSNSPSLKEVAPGCLKCKSPVAFSLVDVSRKVCDISFRGKQTSLRSIYVLSQTDLNEAPVHCGRHAVKNSLVALGYGTQFSARDFVDVETYEAIRYIITSGSLDEDVMSSDLEHSLNMLRNAKEPFYNRVVEKGRIVAKTQPHGVTILLYDQETPFSELGVYSFLDTSCFQSLHNLFDIECKLENKTYFRHAFIIGNSGHWTTLILEQHKNGSLTWYGADSWNNETWRFPAHIRFLENVFYNVSSPQFLLETYRKTVDSSITEQARELRRTGIAQQIVENPQYFIDQLSDAVEFMSTVGWIYDAQQYNREIDDAVILMKFFQCNGYGSDPRIVHLSSILEPFSFS